MILFQSGSYKENREIPHVDYSKITNDAAIKNAIKQLGAEKNEGGRGGLTLEGVGGRGFILYKNTIREIESVNQVTEYHGTITNVAAGEDLKALGDKFRTTIEMALLKVLEQNGVKNPTMQMLDGMGLKVSIVSSEQNAGNVDITFRIEQTRDINIKGMPGFEKSV